MTAGPFKLDMYLQAHTAPLFAELRAVVCADIDFEACLPATARRQLYLGQICGIDFANAGAEDYRYLATFALADEAVPAGHYRSVLVTPAKGGLKALEEFRPDQHLVAVNEPGSFSGAVTFASTMLGSGKGKFPHHQITGSHAASLDRVAQAKVMLASIDCVSFEMVTRQYPEMRDQIRIVGFTAPHPGLPFVTSAQMPDDICAVMSQRLCSFFHGERVKLWSERLGVSGIICLPEASYQAMRAL